MAIAFLFEAAAVLCLVLARDNAMLFVILSAVVFFGWARSSRCFPLTLTDTFGTKKRLITACIWRRASVSSYGPLAALLLERTGWLPVFGIVNDGRADRFACAVRA